MPVFAQSAGRKIMPTSVVFGGHSYMASTFGVTDQSQRTDQVLCAMLGIPRNSVRSTTVSGGTLCGDGASNAGYATILQKVTAPWTLGPYTGRGNLYVYCWGINDPGNYIPASDFGVKTVYAQVRTAFKHCLRTVISRARAATVLEAGGAEQASPWAFGAGFASFANQTLNSGSAYMGASSTTNATATLTIPSDFPGGAITVGFIGAAGANGGTATVTGTFSQSGAANVVTSNLMPLATVQHGHYCRRFSGLPASDAGKTIIFTVTAIDAGGQFGVDYAEIEAQNPPLVAVCNIPRLLANSTYAGYAGSYWAAAGNAGASGDTDVADFNAAITEVQQEFDGAVVVVNLDAVIGKQASSYAADGVHPNPSITPLCAKAIYDAVQSAALPANQLVPDNRVTLGRRAPRLSQCWYDAGEPANMVTSSLTLVTGDEFYLPMVVSEAAERWDGIAFEVMTASTGTGGTVRLGVFSDPDWNDYPYARLIDAGTLATTTTGVKTILTPTMNLAPDSGLLWVVLHVEAAGGTIAGVIRAWTGKSPLVPQSPAGAAPVIGTWTGSTCWKAAGQAAGGLAQSAPAGMTVLTTAAPVICVRRA